MLAAQPILLLRAILPSNLLALPRLSTGDSLIQCLPLFSRNCSVLEFLYEVSGTCFLASFIFIFDYSISASLLVSSCSSNVLTYCSNSASSLSLLSVLLLPHLSCVQVSSPMNNIQRSPCVGSAPLPHYHVRCPLPKLWCVCDWCFIFQLDFLNPVALVFFHGLIGSSWFSPGFPKASARSPAQWLHRTVCSLLSEFKLSGVVSSRLVATSKPKCFLRS